MSDVITRFYKKLYLLCEAVDFYDKVLESSEDDQIAVGSDHHDRLHKAAWDLRDFMKQNAGLEKTL